MKPQIRIPQSETDFVMLLTILIIYEIDKRITKLKYEYP